MHTYIYIVILPNIFLIYSYFNLFFNELFMKNNFLILNQIKIYNLKIISKQTLRFREMLRIVAIVLLRFRDPIEIN